MTLQDLQNEIQKRSVFYAKDLNEPIVNTSGGTGGKWIIDLRTVLLDPKPLRFVAEQFWQKYPGRKKLQIVGMELASVPMIMAIVLAGESHGCDTNGIIIRKSRKKYGLQKGVEGELRKDVETIVVDDLVNSGSSMLKCMVAMLEEGVYIRDVFSILDYSKEKTAEMFAKKGIKHTYLLAHKTVVDLNTSPDTKPQIDLTKFNTQFCFRSNTRLNSFTMFCKSDPLVDDKHVYYGTDEAVFYAIDKHTGEMVWKFEAVPNRVLKGIWSSPCLVRNGVCFGAYDGTLYCLDRDTGKVIWNIGYSNFIGSSPQFVEELNLIFVGLEFGFPGKKGSVAAINATTGELVWEHETHLHVHSSPIYSKKNNMVICGSNDCDMLGLDALTGKKLWRQPLDGGICKMRPTLNEKEDLAFVSCNDGFLHALEVTTGRPRWSYKAQFSILATPLLVGDKVVVGAQDNCIHIVSAVDGSQIEKIRTDGRIFSRPTWHRNKVYVGNNAGAVFEVDLDTCELVGRYQLPERVTSGVAYCEKLERFYVHTNDDRLYAFEIAK